MCLRSNDYVADAHVHGCYASVVYESIQHDSRVRVKLVGRCVWLEPSIKIEWEGCAEQVKDYSKSWC